MAKIDAEMAKEAKETPTMAGRRKSDRSSMGSFCRSSATRKTTISTPDPTSIPTMVVLDHPSLLPRTRAKTNRNSERENEITPIQSIRRVFGRSEEHTSELQSL